ncbi:nitroreductase family protein [Paenibacillus sp. TRM 82003]|nr:nitroreductase family protein [Paenibacillus sp. TRM 82003]
MNIEKQVQPETAAARPTTYPVNPLIVNRWSPRAFDEARDVPEEALFALFEAARLAPSAMNEQPWRYAIARSKEDRETFLSFINEGNRSWCFRAPVLAVLIGKKTYTYNDAPNGSFSFDAGTSWGYLALEAARQGLAAHAMGGFDRAAARSALRLPDDYEPLAAIAIGYQGDPGILNEAQREREKPSPRKPLSDVVFEGGFPG